jgi:hypothetical protein
MILIWAPLRLWLDNYGGLITRAGTEVQETRPLLIARYPRLDRVTSRSNLFSRGWLLRSFGIASTAGFPLSHSLGDGGIIPRATGQLQSQALCANL